MTKQLENYSRYRVNKRRKLYENEMRRARYEVDVQLHVKYQHSQL